MTTHLTAEQMQNYLVRRVSVDEVGQMSEHLHGCRTCYGAYLTVLQRRFPLEIDFDELGGLKDWHLDGKELADFIEGRMSELDFGYARLHLRECNACEQRVYRASRSWDEYPPSTDIEESFGASWHQYLAGFHSSSHSSRMAAGLLLAIGFALLAWIAVQLNPREFSVAKIPVPETPSHDEQPAGLTHGDPDKALKAGLSHPKTPQHASRSTAHSADARVSVQETDIETTLIARNLVIPSAIEMFDKSPGLAVRGSTTHVESFAVVSPFSTLTKHDRPTFAWTELSGASTYTVSVYDSNLRLVRTSARLTETQWVIPVSLRPGTIYTWTVTAARDGKEIIAPALPTRAEFSVAGQADLLRLKRRIDTTVSHAARGVIYAEAGLLDEAEQELRTHLSVAPTDGRAMKLLETVQSWRRLGPDRRSLQPETRPSKRPLIKLP